MHQSRPDWGLSGSNGSVTSHIWCCKGTLIGTAEEAFMYETAAIAYNPIWYSRKEGLWEGQTYEDAVEFCPEVNPNLSICPYEALCPMANLDPPLGGVITDEPAGSWVPVSDAPNTWISVGPDNTCENYQVVNGAAPDWSTTGGNEELTRHIMCCAGEEPYVIVPAASETSRPIVSPVAPTPEPPLNPTPLPSSPPNLPPTTLPTPYPTPLPVLALAPLPILYPTPKPTQIVNAVAAAGEGSQNDEKYNPIWYDRDSGWTGTTYDEAFSFCSQKGPGQDICPYEVICPGGPLNLPYGGALVQTSWAPINTPFNSWVMVSSPQLCVRYENLNRENHPMWGLTGEDSEVLTRNVLCCDMDNAAEGGGSQSESAPTVDPYSQVMEKYAPKWFDRSNGWSGKTYAEAISFCAENDSQIPCPYSAYCPLGEGSVPTGGFNGVQSAWAAIMDSPNGWVNTAAPDDGSESDSCKRWDSLNENPPVWGLLKEENDRNPHIMCCREPENHFIDGMEPPESIPDVVATTIAEEEILGEMDPVWFNSKHGYQSTTYVGAVAFCKNIGGRSLCPKSAYCPSDSDKELFLQRDPFPGDQWAPVASKFDTGTEDWVYIGEGPGTCNALDELQLPQPVAGWDIDDVNNVLCCQNPNHFAKQQSLRNQMDPVWMDSLHGWQGGTHDEATQFCDSFGNRKLCPYSAYCPNGPGQSVMGGQSTDFRSEGEQWAPVFGEKSEWVMIGAKYQNIATTCMGNQELEGDFPDLDISKENANMKKHLMCCSF